MSFTEPDILATFDRSYGEKKERLQLERGEYNGKPTFALRLTWQAENGLWRWAQQKEAKNGKCYAQMNIRAHELEELGRALIEAANSPALRPGPGRAAGVRAGAPRGVDFNKMADAPETDDIPF